ncbi:MAG: glutamate 5-kinase [Oscillospiraceae bacterium]|jgi:glutamate 5-kinase|nr:glutamate 5-kinase [Oscillospiraceae bacterium]
MIGLRDAKRIVFKVGTSTLTYENGKTNLRRMSKLACVLADLANSGKEVVLVSSGAISVGVGKIGLSAPLKDTPSRQAAACVGQCELMFLYDKFFSEYGRTIGQLLITRYDVENAEHRKNLINAFDKMLGYGIIPILNENDSVAVEELAFGDAESSLAVPAVFGDNDNLSAIVAKLVNADALVILSDIDGLFSANPHEDETAQIIPVVEKIDDSHFALAGGAGSARGTGGMFTKLQAAQTATDAGIDTVIMNGGNPEEIYKLFDMRHVGTWFKKQ